MKIKTSSFAAVAAVLLAFCLVFMIPAAADDTTYYVSPDGTGDGLSDSNFASLTSILASLNETTVTPGKYIILMKDGTYTESYSVVRAVAGVDVVLRPISETGNVVISGTINVYNRGGALNQDNPVSITFERLQFELSVTNDKAILIPAKESVPSLLGLAFAYQHANPGIINILGCTFMGTYDQGHIQNGILAGTGADTSNLIIGDTTFNKVSHPVGGNYGNADVIEISGCTITNSEEGINLQYLNSETYTTITGNNIESSMLCIRIGTSNTNNGDILIEENQLSVKNPGNNGGAVVFRGETINNLTISENAMEGSVLLNFGPGSAPLCDVTGELNLDKNYWKGEDPLAEGSSLINWGNAVGENERPTSVEYYETNPLVPSTPLQPITPVSSSGGHAEPGAYFNYPRTVTDGGLVEFGTSKVVKSVTLPAGSSGKVNLHIDSTAYWPLSLDSEFTFDISVDNLGEGTSYISFKIAESKLTALELTAADVGVYHNVNGEWVKLVVTYTIEDGDVIYTAETDSFSPFKLVIEEGAAVQKEEVTPSEPVVDEPVIPDVPQDVPGEVLPDIPDIQDEPETPASPAPLFAVLAALGAAVVLRRK